MSPTEPLILYVDDERGNRVVFKQSLASRFPRITTVASGEEALEVLQTEDVGVLVTDQRMPGMSGNDLLLLVRERHPQVVRIVVTAYDDLEPILRAVNEGLVARYLIKPWVRSELEDVLAWALEAYRLGTESSVLQLRLMQTERLATIGSIAAAVMHDIAQPISYLMANTGRLHQLSRVGPALTELVELHGDDLDPEDRALLADLAGELPEIADDMDQGCNVILNLSQTLRNIMRPSGNTARSCDPQEALRYAMSVCREIAIQARGAIVYEGPPQLPNVPVPSTELIQVLINLISNAAQALQRREATGGIVAVNATVLGKRLRIAIEDNGPGMSQDILSRLGTPFFSTRSEGTGLGLVQVRRLIERAGGTLRIDSTEGVGTTVTVEIPTATPGA